MYTKLFQLFLPYGIYIVSWNIIHLSFTDALFWNHLFQGSAPFWSHFFLYVVRIGTRLYSEPVIKTRHRWASQIGIGAVNVRILRAS